MRELAQLAPELLGALMGGFAPPVAKARRAAIGTGLIAIFGLTAYVAAAVALWFALMPLIGPALSALVLAGLALLAVLVVWAVTAVLDARAKARAEAARSAALQSALAETALQTIPKLIADHPAATLAVAAGLVFALTPRPDR
ncbi:hypothetical protein C8J27_102185 [Rhodobacter aestuarii]|uniref:Holin-X, holin superfamily III n=1 Tax=Rhodobacter aestuarii TaxID=453582 RepID=A0A1N7NDG4_9RHOB|nr:hypothetical protein [Rhodobacter aestuarii]PTV96391.1 hypothetical protein C8J27_102185 [Rhodobacter aestuarii]SIS96281.1 hypothetical protein SAMN05421580_107185 [Rhodobacter aestuarii]